MRLFAISLVALVLAAPASAAAPRFGVYDLGTDVARASTDDYGDISVATNEETLARRSPGATLIRCAAGCRLGRGWIAFAKPSVLRAGDVRAARAHASAFGWAITISLSVRGGTAWTRFARTLRARQKRNGVPDVLAIVLDDTIFALPYAVDTRRSGDSLELAGFTPAGARAAAKLLG
jgi:hypothetical protein